MKSKQSLHDLCDEIYSQQLQTESMVEMLSNNKIIPVYNKLGEISKNLAKILFELREKALREEGEQKR